MAHKAGDGGVPGCTSKRREPGLVQRRSGQCLFREWAQRQDHSLINLWSCFLLCLPRLFFVILKKKKKSYLHLVFMKKEPFQIMPSLFPPPPHLFPSCYSYLSPTETRGLSVGSIGISFGDLCDTLVKSSSQCRGECCRWWTFNGHGYF